MKSWLLFLLLISFNINALESSLTNLIAVMNDFSPENTKLQSLDDLSNKLNTTPPEIRLTRTKQIVQALTDYQFPPDLTLRELVANAIDSYYYDSNLKVDARAVNILSKQEEISITDQGLGMSLQEIIFFLLAPSRSFNNAILTPEQGNSGVTGRFGQGFFSVLSFLKTESDKITVNTKKEGSNGLSIVLYKKNGEIFVQITQDLALKNRGTSITIQSAGDFTNLANSVIPKYFVYNQRAQIFINNMQINKNLLKEETVIEQGIAEVDILVNGVLIKDFFFTANNILQKVVIDLPANTKLTADRGTLDYKDQNAQNILLDLAKNALSKKNYPLFNSIYPLLGNDYFAVQNKLGFITLPTNVIPALPELKKITQINDQKVLRINAEFFFKVKHSLPNLINSSNIYLIPTNFNDATNALVYRNKGIKWVFVKNGMDLKNPNTLPLINLLYQIDQEKDGQKSAPILFSKEEMLELQGVETKRDKIGSYTGSDLITPGKDYFATVENTYDLFVGKTLVFFNTQLAFKLAYNLAVELYEPTSINRDKIFAIRDAIEKAVNKDELSNIIKNEELLKKLIDNLKKFIMMSIEIENLAGEDLANKLLKAIDTFEPSQIIDGTAEKYFQQYMKFFREVLRYVDPKNQLQVLPINEQQEFENLNGWISLCKNMQINDCENLITGGFSKFNNDLPESNIQKAKQYLQYYNQIEDNKFFSSMWQTFELNYLINLSNPASHQELIHLLHDLFNSFCYNRAVTFKITTSMKQRYEVFATCSDRLSILLNHFLENKISKSAIKNLQNFIAKQLPGWFDPISGQAYTADEYFNLIRINMPEDIFGIIYPLLFGDEKFYEENINYSMSENLSPIWEYPKVQEIMGKDENLIKKNYITALEQNPQAYVWIKEVVKNAFEAGSKDFDVRVNTDTENQLVVELLDSGSGVQKDNMYFFFVPGLTSKPRDKDDINFGWGFFTLFKDFDEAIVESSTDGVTKNVLYLKKDPQNLFYIAEESQKISNKSFTQGTRISLRKIVTASKTAPIEVKANLLSFVDGFPNLKITFNNEELKKSSKIGLSGEPLLTALFPKDSTKKIEFYAHPQGGLFYNNLAHAMNINNYIELLLPEIKKLVNLVPYQLAINLKGDFKQNANRTGFIELENYQDFIKENFLKAAFLLIAKEVQDKPDILAGYLPYDFYYEFRFSDHLLNNINNIGNLKKDDIGKYLLGINLPCGYSLIELKNNIFQLLKSNNIVNSNGKYNKDANLPDNLLNSICSDKLATKFESEIRNQFLLMDSQASISKDDVDPNLSENDFKLENLPLDFESKRTNLKIFKDFFENIAKNYLNIDLDIWFYHAADASGAHAMQGQSALKKIIAFNLIGGYYNAFENMLIKKEWDDKVYFDVIETMTHEITHAHEPSMSSTHDRSFYESQEKWLQKFFDKSISQKGFLRIFKRLYID